jgi:hypothetical protein
MIVAQRADKRIQPGIYTSGEYAPWSAGNLHWGCPYEQVYAFPELAGAAVGIELRQPSSCDPPGVLDLRYRLVNILQCWRTGSTTADCDPMRLARGEIVSDGGGFGGSDEEGECRELVRGYPWGRRFAPPTTAGPIRPSVGGKGVIWLLGALLLLLCLLVLAALVAVDYRVGGLQHTMAAVWWIPAMARRRKRRANPLATTSIQQPNMPAS